MTRTVYVIACAAPPVLDLPALLGELGAAGWAPCVILTPTAATWTDPGELADLTGRPVRVRPRLPGEQDPLPPADGVVAAPVTFNTLNKWAAGISDTLALGLLSELLAADVPVVAAPCVKAALRRHPAYGRSVALLTGAGVRVLDPDRVTVRRAGRVTADWTGVVRELDGETKG